MSSVERAMFVAVQSESGHLQVVVRETIEWISLVVQQSKFRMCMMPRMLCPFSSLLLREETRMSIQPRTQRVQYQYEVQTIAQELILQGWRSKAAPKFSDLFETTHSLVGCVGLNEEESMLCTRQNFTPDTVPIPITLGMQARLELLLDNYDSEQVPVARCLGALVQTGRTLPAESSLNIRLLAAAT